MKKLLCAVLFTAIAAPATAADIGVSVNIGEPGFFGQIDIGNAPAPQVVYAQPTVVEAAPEFAAAPPIYLHVRPGYEANWKAHCHEYNACGRPVYFVRDDWYQHQYVPHYRQLHPVHPAEVRHDEHRDEHGDEHHDPRRDDRHDDPDHHDH